MVGVKEQIKHIIYKIKQNGVKKEYPEVLKLHIQLTNLLVVFFSAVGFFLQFTVFSKTRITFYLLFLPQILYLVIFLLIRYHLHVLGRLLFAILLPIYIAITSAFIYYQPDSSGVVGKLLLGSMIVLPFVLFSSQEWYWAALSMGLNTLLLIFYDKINQRLNFDYLSFNFDNPTYNIYGILTVVLMTSVMVLYLKRLLINKHNQLQKTLEELKQLNDELHRAKEEISEQNAELHTLNLQLEHQKLELEKRNKFFTLLAEHAYDAIVIINSKGKIILWNKAAEQLFGYKKEEVMGKFLGEIVVPEQFRLKHLNRLRELEKLKAPVNKRLETRALTKDGRLIDVELSINSIYLYDEYYFLGIARDITERKNFIRQLQKQKEIISRQLKEIQESLDYAKYIQEKLLPSLEPLNKYFPEYFLIYKPKAQVSGDFYFVREKNDKLIIAIGDCTGHGLPGALLTVLAINFLNEISDTEYESPSKILSLLREKIKLAINTRSSSAYEGIDMGILIIDLLKIDIKYSGAFLSLYVINNNELHIYKGDRMPVGAYIQEKDFKEYYIKPQPFSMFYLFTDGYADQIGFYSQNKFSRKRLQKLLLSIYTQPAKIQEQILIDAFEKWKKQETQIDDVTVLGFRF